MSIKTDFKNTLTEASSKSAAAKQRVIDICKSDQYTEIGRKAAAERILNDLAAYLDAEKAKVNDAVAKKIEFMDKEEAFLQDRRNRDAGYQAGLATAIQILPHVIGNCEPNEIRTWLSTYENDAIAIAALESAARGANAAEAKNKVGLDTLKNMEMMPHNTNGEKQKRLEQLRKTMITHLDNMMVSVNDRAWSGYSAAANSYMIAGGAIIDATINYINNCNDDCTIYTEPEA